MKCIIFYYYLSIYIYWIAIPWLLHRHKEAWNGMEGTAGAAAERQREREGLQQLPPKGEKGKEERDRTDVWYILHWGQLVMI